MEVKISQAIPMITDYIKAKLVPMVIGSPGCGKSQIVHQIAKEYGLKLIDLRLSQCDPTDLLGFPHIDKGRASYVPMSTFPIESDNVPEGFNGWLLFLDEFNSASPAVQAAAYKLVLDHMVGQYKLHKNVAIVCAGNKDTDNAIVESMSTALQSRLAHIELTVDYKEWLSWAIENGIDHRITSFIRFKPSQLYTFKPDHSDHTYACPRTWEFANRIFNGKESNDELMVHKLSGLISEGVAREFLVFCKIYKSLPSIEDIISNPEKLDVPDEPSILFALTGSIAHSMTKETADTLIKFIKRMPVEFQVVCLREAIKRNKTITSSTAIQKWITDSAVDLFT